MYLEPDGRKGLAADAGSSGRRLDMKVDDAE